MNNEIIGTLASIFVLISFTMKGERKIRIINIIGAILFIIYGIIDHLFSIWFLNGILVIIHCYNLFKPLNLNKNKKIDKLY